VFPRQRRQATAAAAAAADVSGDAARRRRGAALAVASSRAPTQRPDGRISHPSSYRGVTWHKATNRWQAQLCYDGKKVHLGYFLDEKEAALVYDREALKHKGPGTTINFPIKAQTLGSGLRKPSGPAPSTSPTGSSRLRNAQQASAKASTAARVRQGSGSTRSGAPSSPSTASATAAPLSTGAAAPAAAGRKRPASELHERAQGGVRLDPGPPPKRVPAALGGSGSGAPPSPPSQRLDLQRQQLGPPLPGGSSGQAVLALRNSQEAAAAAAAATGRMKLEGLAHAASQYMDQDLQDKDPHQDPHRDADPDMDLDRRAEERHEAGRTRMMQRRSGRGPALRTSEYRGVTWKNQINKWRVQLKYKGKVIHLGCFYDERKAALAYDRAARQILGHRASLNFPNQPPEPPDTSAPTRPKAPAAASTPPDPPHVGPAATPRSPGSTRVDMQYRQQQTFQPPLAPPSRHRSLAALSHPQGSRSPQGQGLRTSQGLMSPQGLGYGSRSAGPTLSRRKHSSSSSTFLGVSWSSQMHRWRVQINGGPRGYLHLGYFKCEQEAARMYDRCALALRGDHATLNFPAMLRHYRALPQEELPQAVRALAHTGGEAAGRPDSEPGFSKPLSNSDKGGLSLLGTVAEAAAAGSVPGGTGSRRPAGSRQLRAAALHQGLAAKRPGVLNPDQGGSTHSGTDGLGNPSRGLIYGGDFLWDGIQLLPVAPRTAARRRTKAPGTSRPASTTQAQEQAAQRQPDTRETVPPFQSLLAVQAIQQPAGAVRIEPASAAVQLQQRLEMESGAGSRGTQHPPGATAAPARPGQQASLRVRLKGAAAAAAAAAGLGPRGGALKHVLPGTLLGAYRQRRLGCARCRFKVVGCPCCRTQRSRGAAAAAAAPAPVPRSGAQVAPL